MHLSVVASMEAGAWAGDAADSGKEAKEIGGRLFQEEGLAGPKACSQLSSTEACSDRCARESVRSEHWWNADAQTSAAAHPSFTHAQKVLPYGTVPQPTAHCGYGGLWMAIHEETARIGVQTVHKFNNGQ